MAVAVVGGALFGVGEDLVGLGALLELSLGGGVVGITVGMVLHGELAVGSLELGVGGGAGDFEELVIVDFGHVGGWHALLFYCVDGDMTGFQPLYRCYVVTSAFGLG